MLFFDFVVLYATMYVVFKVAVEDLFGEVAEERDVTKIATKMPEARGSRSNLSLEILSRLISLNKIDDVLNPLQEVRLYLFSSKYPRKVFHVL